MPLPRMTTRRWMVAVAVVGAILFVNTMVRTSYRARQLARQHRREANAAGTMEQSYSERVRDCERTIVGYESEIRVAEQRCAGIASPETQIVFDHEASRLRFLIVVERGTIRFYSKHAAQWWARRRFHESLAERYELAARRPWLPVPPDPPAPE